MFRSSLGNNIKSDSGNKKADACEFGRLRLFGPCAAFFCARIGNVKVQQHAFAKI